MSEIKEICMKCGETISAEAKFCASCGSSAGGVETSETRQRKVRPAFLIGGLVAVVAVVVISGLALSTNGTSSRQSSGGNSSPSVSMNDKCALRVARWTDALSTQMMNGYGSASSDLYFTLGSQNPWTDWILESAREYAAASLQVGDNQAAANEVANIRQRCAQMGNPILELPHGQ